MSPPESCTVLVAGGGPGGSFAAAALAREGIDVVLIESDQHPRYHIGESLLPSMRTLLRFIDLEEEYDKHGFQPKLGATFKLNAHREAYTNFIDRQGPSGAAWNVIRSQSDEILFRHAAKSGAKTFENTKVNSIQFEPCKDDGYTEDVKLINPGKPVSAEWTRKDGSSGTIKFKYLVDATGRHGIMSTKYLKNRRYNAGLKNIAFWGYFRGGKVLSEGTEREGQPFFEGLRDGSGWIWCIPLHDGTYSVGAVLRQDLFQEKKKGLGEDTTLKEVFMECVNHTPHIKGFLEGAELVTDIKQTSDFSYAASAYAGPNFRLVGDAGCFIDPFFSSGHHLALTGALISAITIAASIKGDVPEVDAARFHAKKITEGYTVFLLVVMAALKQIRNQDAPVLSDVDGTDFDTAFDFFRPVIQGASDQDMSKRFTQEHVAKTIDYCFNALDAFDDTETGHRVMKMAKSGVNPMGKGYEAQQIPEEDMKILQGLMVFAKATKIEDISKIEIDGLSPNVETGNLGLRRVQAQ